MLYVSGAVAALISAVVGTLVGILVGLLIEKFHKERAFRRTQTNHNRADLYSHYNDVIANGFTTPHEIEVWEPLYQEYKAGKGNGVIDRLHAEVTELPIKPD